MKREIKFRAWHTQAKYMYKFDDLNAYTFELFKKPEEHSFIVMQYTGLKDKNGKEIYEGDVCIVYLKDDLQEEMVVKWDEEGCGFRFYSNDGGFWRVTHTPIEVIGNIYEKDSGLKGVGKKIVSLAR